MSEEERGKGGEKERRVERNERTESLLSTIVDEKGAGLGVVEDCMKRKGRGG